MDSKLGLWKMIRFLASYILAVNIITLILLYCTYYYSCSYMFLQFDLICNMYIIFVTTKKFAKQLLFCATGGIGVLKHPCGYPVSEVARQSMKP